MRKRKQQPKRKQHQKQGYKAQRASEVKEQVTIVTTIKQFVIFPIALILVLLLWEIFKPVIILDPIEIPDDLKISGYTGKVLAEQLADAAKEMANKVRNSTLDLNSNVTDRLETKSPFLAQFRDVLPLKTSAHLEDIQIPVINVSFRSFVRFIKQEFGIKSSYLHGELTHDRDEFILTLRNKSMPDIPVVRVITNDKAIKQLVQEGGKAILKLTKPSILAADSYLLLNKQIYYFFIDRPTFVKAEEIFEYCIKYPPDSDDALVYTMYGASYYLLKNYNEAIKSDPKFEFTYNSWGNSLVELKRYDEAVNKYKEAIGIDPKFASAYLNWGNTLISLNKLDEAIIKYKKAIEVDPKFAIAHVNWGNVLILLNKFDEASIQFQKAIKADPQFADAHYNMGFVLNLLGRKNEAMKEYEMTIEIDPSYAPAYQNLGKILSEFKRYDDEILQYQKVTEIYPKFTKAYISWGVALGDLNRFDEELKLYEKAVSIDPYSVVAYYNWGAALNNQNRSEEAIIKFKKAIEIDPKAAYVYKSWGNALLKLKRPEEAQQLFIKYESLNTRQ